MRTGQELDRRCRTDALLPCIVEAVTLYRHPSHTHTHFKYQTAYLTLSGMAALVEEKCCSLSVTAASRRKMPHQLICVRACVSFRACVFAMAMHQKPL